MASDNHKHKRLVLEGIRCSLLAPLNAIIGYSDLLAHEFTFEKGPNDHCMLAIQRILKEARALQKKVDLSFTKALAQSQDSNYQIKKFIMSLEHTLLKPLYAIIGNYELIKDKGLLLHGEHLENDCRQIYQAAKIFIRTINKIKAAIEENEGSSLYLSKLTIPLKRVTEHSYSIKKSIQKPISGTLMVIDDNAMTVDLWLRQGEHFGYRTMTCSDSESALKTLNALKIDLVLLQIIMEHMNGLELLQKIRSYSKFDNIPIIAISPLKHETIALTCLKMGANDYLAEPLAIEILKARINDALEKKKLLDKENEYILNTKKQKEEVENLLLSNIPESLASRIEQGELFIADRSEEASILFVDIANFSHIVDQISPQQTVRLLNKIFSAIDDIIDTHKVEKIKTIGDSYMAAAGIPEPSEKHAHAIAEVALEILSIIKNINVELNMNIRLRLGISSGPVVAGILGMKKIIYDVWGKTVNLASRIEAQGVPDKIQVSESTFHLLKNDYELIFKGESEVRGLGLQKIYFLVGRKSRIF